MLQHTVRQHEVERSAGEREVADTLHRLDRVQRDAILDPMMSKPQAGDLESLAMDIERDEATIRRPLPQRDRRTPGAATEIEHVETAQVGEGEDLWDQSLPKATTRPPK